MRRIKSFGVLQTAKLIGMWWAKLEHQIHELHQHASQR